MKKSCKRGIIAVILAAAIIIAAAIIAAIPSCGSRIDFSAQFYFVCYKSADDAHSASSISSTVQSYGGAGYIIKLGSNYHVAVACYYSREDVESVMLSLADDGLSCQVIEAYAGGYDIPRRLSGQKSNISGALATLSQLGSLFYETANGLDGGTLTNAAAVSVLGNARAVLNAAMSENEGNALYSEINYLLALVDDLDPAYVYAREVRALQIAVCDCLLNVNFS